MNAGAKLHTVPAYNEESYVINLIFKSLNIMFQNEFRIILLRFWKTSIPFRRNMRRIPMPDEYFPNLDAKPAFKTPYPVSASGVVARSFVHVV